MTGGWHPVKTQCPPDCGMCCESIMLQPGAVEQVFGPTFEERQANEKADQVVVRMGLPNPRKLTYGHDPRFIREHFHIEGVRRLGDGNATFAADDPGWGITFSCDAFDPVARACTAYEERPLMCENYPFYGRDPEHLTHKPINDLVCAFHDNVPPRKVLPLTVLRG